MAGTRLFPNHQRTPSLRGSLLRYYSNGQWLVRAWPRKTGKPKSLKVQRQNNWFRDAVQLAKRLPAPYQELAKEMALDTGLYPKDPLMASMAGNLYEVVLEDGTTVEKWIPQVHPIVFTGCRLLRTSNLAIASGVDTDIPWQQAALDTAGFFDPADPTLITIPTGVNVVSLDCGLNANSTSNTFWRMAIVLNGAGIMAQFAGSPVANHRATLSTGPIAVAPGLQFRATLLLNLSTTLWQASGTFLSLTVLDAD